MPKLKTDRNNLQSLSIGNNLSKSNRNPREKVGYLW